LSSSAKRKEIFLEVASKELDQELLNYLMIEDEDDELSSSMSQIESGSKVSCVKVLCYALEC